MHKALQNTAPTMGRSSIFLEDVEWVVGTTCALHACHISLKWPLHWRFADKELLNNIYVSVESLRTSFIGELLDLMGP